MSLRFFLDSDRGGLVALPKKNFAMQKQQLRRKMLERIAAH
jgi:hypothetical protein